IGMILGTAAYMSPEQAKGRPADKRSDVWAFGCLLFEMLTGKCAFDGEDISDTLASVLRSEPDWGRLPDGTPTMIRVLVERCLAKDRRQRVGDISAVQFVLAQGTRLSGAAALPAPPSTLRTLLKWPLALAAATLATGVLLGLATSSFRPRANPPIVTRFT